MSEASVFESLNETTAPTPVAEVAASSDANKEARKAKVMEMKRAMDEAIAEDPSFMNKLHSLSDSLCVVNSLGWGNGQGLVENKDSTKDNRLLDSVSAIVGYRVKNQGTEPIPYTTEIWERGEDGKYVGKIVERVLEAGGTADLTRRYMTRLCAIPEISFQLANGKVIRGSSKTGHRIEAEMDAHYFSFNKDVPMQVHDDSVKLAVGVKDADGNWTVKPEFVEVFGYLNNPKEKSGRTRKSSGMKMSSSDIFANYINQMIKKSESSEM